jgi:hypothetical protein
VKGNSEFTAVLGWPGYQVYRHAIDEQQKHLTVWVRRKRGRGYKNLRYLLLKAKRIAVIAA